MSDELIAQAMPNTDGVDLGACAELHREIARATETIRWLQQEVLPGGDVVESTCVTTNLRGDSAEAAYFKRLVEAELEIRVEQAMLAAITTLKNQADM